MKKISRKNLDKSQTKIFLVSWKVQSLLCKTIFLDKVYSLYILILLPTQGQGTEWVKMYNGRLLQEK